MKGVDVLAIISMLLNFGEDVKFHVILNAEGLKHCFVSAAEMV